MTDTAIDFPALSPELEFVALNEEDAQQIWDGAIEVDQSIRELLDAVGDRADADAAALLHDIQTAIDAAVRHLVRVTWTRGRRENWELAGTVYSSRGRPRAMAYAGIYIRGGDTPAFVGWVYPRRGGLDGRRELTRLCAKRATTRDVHLASENVERYAWGATDDAVIWCEQTLARLQRRDLEKVARRRAKQFFQVAAPVLKQLAAG